MTTSIRLALLAVSALAVSALVACSPPDDEPDCEDKGTVTGTAQFAQLVQPVREDAVIVGTAVHSRQRAIRSIVVEGVEATADGFNFSRWSVTIPFHRLAARIIRGDTQPLSIKITATDACETRTEIPSIDATIDETFRARVDTLAITRVTPQQAFIPATRGVASRLLITANPDASGVPITVSTTLGTLVGPDGGSILLTGDGEAPATAVVFLSSDREGEAIVVAASGNARTETIVPVVGPPRFTPASGELAPGQTLRTTVLVDGDLASCRATATPGFDITSGGVDLLQGTIGSEGVVNGIVEVFVSTATTSPAGSATVTCLDSFGQIGQATFLLSRP